MQVRCPECHTYEEVLDEDPLVEVSCSSCGATFSLLALEASTEPVAIHSVGQFDLLDQVGQGAFGTVWRARDRDLDRIVAVKLPRQEQLDGHEAERFLREARAAAQLRHPGIVSLYEVGRQGRQVYIVSEFVQGATLAEWLRAKPLSSRQAAELIVQVAEALNHAHQKGVIHRDLKPANILMDGQGRPHLTDFGLAKRQSAEVTMTMEGQILGTPAYMSPEQARGETHKVDARSDVYSLGVILFQLLTGEVPFRGSTQMMIVQLLNDDPPSPRKLNAAVSRDLETIALKCLAGEPGKRYQAPMEVADDLRRWLDGAPILARPLGPFGRLWRWCKRNPKIAVLEGTVVGLLLVVAIGTTLAAMQLRAVAQQERLARAEAEASFQRAVRAVDEITDVGQNWLSDVPRMQPVRQTLLESALGFYVELLDQRPTDLALLKEIAHAHHRVGDIYTMLGRLEQARTSYEEAVARFQALVSQHPNQPEYQNQLAISRNYLAELLRMSGKDLQEAEELYRGALQLETQLSSQFPENPAYRQEVSRAWNNLGLLLLETGRSDEAQHALEEAVKYLSRLVSQHAEEAKYQEELARSHINLGILLRNQMQRPGDAAVAYARAVELLEKLVQQSPDSRDYRYKLAVSRVDLGNLWLRDESRRQDAEQEYLKARTLFEALDADYPNVPLYRADLANCYNSLGGFLALSGRLDEAQEVETKARELFESLTGQFPAVPDYQSRLGMTLGVLAWLALERGRSDAARTLVEQAIDHQISARQSNPDNPEYSYRLSEHYVFLSEVLVKQGELDLAVERLRGAVDLGYSNLKHLKSDAFLPLASRDDFRLILDGLEKGR